MIAPEALPAATVEREPATASRDWRWVTLAFALAALIVGAALWWTTASRAPGDASLEAGFARDMIVHHDQAVTMALLIRDRTSDPAVKTLATDILLTQQNQIGQMLGWLNFWGLPATGAAPAMAWMGHPTTGLMPGMATPEEMANLERRSGDAADVAFLQMMIRHHRGGIPMAEAALERSGSRPVRDLARAIVTTQEAEIAAMQALLDQKDAGASETGEPAP